jgi:hypothetical protein
MTASIYCDESGNTGANYFDSSQPVYVLAGVVARTPRPLEDAIDALFTASRGGGETKATNLLRTHGGRRRVAEVLIRVAGMGCRFAWVAADKRFCLACNVVDTFLDVKFNDHAYCPPALANIDRRRIATLIAKFPDNSLQMFHQAYLDPSKANLENALEALVGAATESDQPLLADMLGATARNIPGISAEQLSGWHDGGRLQQAVNVAVVGRFFGLAESAASTMKIRRLSVVHDETREFEPLLRQYFSASNALGEAGHSITMQDGRTIQGTRRLQDFTIAVSHESKPVRVADALAATIRYATTFMMTPGQMDPSIASLFSGPLRADRSKSDVIASDEALARLASAIAVGRAEGVSVRHP